MEKNISVRLFAASLSAKEHRLIYEASKEVPRPQLEPKEWKPYDPPTQADDAVNRIESFVRKVKNFPLQNSMEQGEVPVDKKNDAKKAPEAVRIPEDIRGEINSIVKDLKGRNAAGSFEVSDETQKKLDRMSVCIKDYRGVDDAADQLVSDTAAAVGLLYDKSLDQSFGLDYDAATQKFSYKRAAATPEAPVPSVAPTEQQKTWLNTVIRMIKELKEWFSSILKEGANSGDPSIMRMRRAELSHDIKDIESSPDYKDKDKQPGLRKKIDAMQAEIAKLDAGIKAAEAKTKQFVQDANAKVEQANKAAPGSVPLKFGYDESGQPYVAGAPGAPAAVVKGQLIYLYGQLPAGTAVLAPGNHSMTIIRNDNSVRVNIGDNNNINVGKGNVAGGGRGSDAYSPNRIYRDSANSGPNIGPYARGGRTYNSMGRTYGFKTPPGSGAHNVGRNA